MGPCNKEMAEGARAASPENAGQQLFPRMRPHHHQLLAAWAAAYLNAQEADQISRGPAAHRWSTHAAVLDMAFELRAQAEALFDDLIASGAFGPLKPMPLPRRAVQQLPTA